MPPATAMRNDHVQAIVVPLAPKPNPFGLPLIETCRTNSPTHAHGTDGSLEGRIDTGKLNSYIDTRPAIGFVDAARGIAIQRIKGIIGAHLQRHLASIG